MTLDRQQTLGDLSVGTAVWGVERYAIQTAVLTTVASSQEGFIADPGAGFQIIILDATQTTSSIVGEQMGQLIEETSTTAITPWMTTGLNLGGYVHLPGPFVVTESEGVTWADKGGSLGGAGVVVHYIVVPV